MIRQNREIKHKAKGREQPWRTETATARTGHEARAKPK
jgi:hypothetical protein